MIPFDVVTFDCYGTLIDWERGIAEAFTAEARRAGREAGREAVIAAYHEVEPRVEASAFRPYREVLAESARLVAERLGWSMDESSTRAFAATLPDWPLFPDTGPALDRLARGGFHLGILSNVDDDLLAATLRHLPRVFDPELIVTAQAVGSYKPAVGHFLEAQARIGGRRWLHAAQSHFHDVTPAIALGVPVAWINRKGEPLPAGGAKPTLETADLDGLGRALVPVKEPD